MPVFDSFARSETDHADADRISANWDRLAERDECRCALDLLNCLHRAARDLRLRRFNSYPKAICAICISQRTR
jgi:hypothetical protein